MSVAIGVLRGVPALIAACSASVVALVIASAGRQLVEPNIGVGFDLFATVLIAVAAATVAVAVIATRTGSSGLESEERRRADSLKVELETALRQEAEERRILFDTSKNLILIADHDGRIVRTTPSVRQILGFDAREIVGRQAFDFMQEADRRRARVELARTQRALGMHEFNIDLLNREGVPVALAWSCAWSATERKFFCIGRDRTEINSKQNIIAAQNAKLDLALTNMSHGLLMLDGSGAVVLANSHFTDMFGLDRAVVAEGTPVGRIVAHALRTRLFRTPDRSVARFADWSTTSAEFSEQRELADGRTINVKLSRLAGGGILGTFEDITKLQSALKTLAINHEMLEKREAELHTKHLQLDAAINNMRHGLVMLDAERRVAVCNDQILKMYGLSRDEIASGMPITEVMALRVAKGVTSKQHLDKGFEAFGRSLAETDGSSFVAEMLDGRQMSVCTQPMSSGGWVVTVQDVTDERQREAQISHMARHDNLTDLPNRVVLAEALELAMSHCQRGSMAALHFLDLDYFKTVNDTLGHAIGDKLLLAVSNRLRQSVRQSDTVVRLGGDEFAVLQTFIERPEDATTLAKRLIESIGAPYEIEGRPISIGVSVGIAVSPGDGLTGEDLLKNSDLALYRAKELGRGDYHFFEASLDRRMQKRRDLEDELRKALKEGQLELHYQPLVSSVTKTIRGVEALLRWRHPERGMISPMEFVPVAEELGLITTIGEWVIGQACAVATTWPDDVRIAVNLSPVQFRRGDIVRIVADALSTTGLAPQRLEVEITESVLLEANEHILGILHRLRDLGVGIALDDFGTGYSSLGYLQNFPFTRIKIDRSFVKNLGVQDSAAEIIRSIVAIARAVNMKITAEGIETEEQLRIAIASGCSEFQGYLFSKPRPVDEIAGLLSRRIEALVRAA